MAPDASDISTSHLAGFLPPVYLGAEPLTYQALIHTPPNGSVFVNRRPRSIPCRIVKLLNPIWPATYNCWQMLLKSIATVKHYFTQNQKYIYQSE